MIKFINVYNKALIKIRKEVSGRGLRPSEFNDLVPQIQNRHFEDIYRRYSTDTENTSKIRRFYKDFTQIKTSTDDGFVDFNLPSDYYHHRGYVMYKESNDSVNFNTYKKVDILQDSEYMEAVGSFILKPRRYNEKAVIENKYSTSSGVSTPVGLIRVYSDSSFNGSGTMILFPYIRKPVEHPFLYTVGSSGTLTQDDDNGFDFEDEDEDDLINITLEILAMQLKRQDIYQYSQVSQMEDNR